MWKQGRAFVWASTALVLFLVHAARTAEPLHAGIDGLIAASQVGPASPIANDAEFLRRVYLDLTGRIPSPAAAREFLDNKSPDKRTVVIDQLLASPDFARHMAGVLGVMLMERRADKVIPAAEWQQYLHASLAANKPYNQLAREILSADGVDPALRPAAKFYLDRDGEPNLLTRDVGRIFFGRDYQCNQCHDHPIIDSYYQADYYGLFACFNRGVLFTDPKDKKVYFAEKGEGGVAFQSVFDKDARGGTRPRLPGGLQIAEPAFAPGDEYTVKPADGMRPVPKFSRRARLAEEATSGANRAFNENIANRLWAHMLGRGLVEPVDLHHVDNPATHPELLALLADELVAMKFDVKAFLRELALSQAYQRSIDLPEPQLAADDGLAAQIPALEAELQKLTSAASESSKAVEKVQEELRPVRTAAADAATEVGKLAATMGETKKAADAAQQVLAQAQAAVANKQDAASAVTEAATQTEAAAKKLPDEKPLAEAAAKFKERAVQLAAEVAAATKTAADQDGPVKAAAEKLAAAQKSVDEAAIKQSAATTQVEGLEVKNAAAVSKIQADRAAAKLIERRLQTLKALLAYRTARHTRDISQAALAKLDADLNAAKQTVAKLTGDLPAIRTGFDAAQKQQAEALGALSDAQQQFAAKNDLHQTVALAAAKAEAARQKLPNDTELAQAAQTVKTRADQIAAETVELQKALAARQQATDQVAATVAAAKQGIEAATSDIAKFEQQIPTLEPQRKAAADKLAADQQNYSRAAEDLIGHETGQFATASLKPLSPEQIAASVIEAAGLREQLRAASEAEINAKSPLTDAIKNDPAQMAARNGQIDEATYAKLQANFARFVELFGTGAGQPQNFFASADQALFFGNDGQIRGWFAPSGGNLMDRLAKLADPRTVADELYVSVLSRRPTDAEIAEVTSYLTARAAERPAALQELAWGLITSLEFRFSH